MANYEAVSLPVGAHIQHVRSQQVSRQLWHHLRGSTSACFEALRLSCRTLIVGFLHEQRIPTGCPGVVELPFYLQYCLMRATYLDIVVALFSPAPASNTIYHFSYMCYPALNGLLIGTCKVLSLCVAEHLGTEFCHPLTFVSALHIPVVTKASEVQNSQGLGFWNVIHHIHDLLHVIHLYFMGF